MKSASQSHIRNKTNPIILKNFKNEEIPYLNLIKTNIPKSSCIPKKISFFENERQIQTSQKKVRDKHIQNNDYFSSRETDELKSPIQNRNKLTTETFIVENEQIKNQHNVFNKMSFFKKIINHR